MDKMQRALSQFVVQGIHTTIPLHQKIFADEEFRSGAFDTKFMEWFFERQAGSYWLSGATGTCAMFSHPIEMCHRFADRRGTKKLSRNLHRLQQQRRNIRAGQISPISRPRNIVMPSANTLPPFPVIDSVNWEAPSETSPVEVSTSSGPLKIHADADNASNQDFVWDVPTTNNVSPRLNNWWPGAEPVPHSLRLRQFWRQVPGTFTNLGVGDELTNSWQYTHGVSTTDSESITATLGVEGGGVSASISATLSHSVTITDETTTTTQFKVEGPDTGVKVWILWDLMYELAIVDGNGDPISPGTYRGDVDFSNDSHYSGAYLNYKWAKIVISSGSLFPQSQAFPA